MIDFEKSSFEDYSKSKSVSDNNTNFLLQPMIELQTSSKILSEFEKYNQNLVKALEEAKNDWSSKLTELSNDWISQYEVINQILKEVIIFSDQQIENSRDNSRKFLQQLILVVAALAFIGLVSAIFIGYTVSQEESKTNTKICTCCQRYCTKWRFF